LSFNTIEIIIGIMVVFAFGIFSYYTKVVDKSGLFAGLYVGLTIWIFGGWAWFIIILIFHLFAAAATKYCYNEKNKLGFAQEKGGARQWGNVLANGLTASIFALLYFLNSSFMGNHGTIYLVGYVGAISAMMADTIATELGLLSKKSPILITTFKKVEPGTSGGITLLGELAALLGSCIIGFTSWIFLELKFILFEKSYTFIIVICAIIGGLFGCFVDSILGATIQGLYKCEKCNKITEKRVHSCGTISKKIRGINIINNNIVNLISSIFGSAISILIYILI